MKTSFFFALFLFGGLVGSATSGLGEKPKHESVEPRATDLLGIIKQHQSKHVRRSFAPDFSACFTAIHLSRFEAKRIPDQIAEELKASKQFTQTVKKIEELAQKERKALVESARLTYSPTWTEIGEVSPKGQTLAGQAAEKAIAERIANLVEGLLDSSSAVDREPSSKPDPTKEPDEQIEPERSGDSQPGRAARRAGAARQRRHGTTSWHNIGLSRNT